MREHIIITKALGMNEHNGNKPKSGSYEYFKQLRKGAA